VLAEGNMTCKLEGGLGGGHQTYFAQGTKMAKASPEDVRCIFIIILQILMMFVTFGMDLII
jgi:hypothetical protein